MIRRVRFAYRNLVAGGGSIVTASSEQPSLPASWVADQLRSQRWRSQLGYDVVAGLNDRLAFTEDGVTRVATLVPGNYPTPALLAGHVTSRMNAAEAWPGPPSTPPAWVNGYAVLYEDGQFIIGRVTGSATFGLPWATGPESARSFGPDLGFDMGADLSGAITYTASRRSYQSRHWLTVDFGRPELVTFGAALDHNVSSAGRVILSASESAAGPRLFSTVLAGSTGVRVAYVPEQIRRLWRLQIDDIENAAGFGELGLWWLGRHFEPARSVDIRFKDGRDELSRWIQTPHGAHFQDRRPRRKVLEVRFSWLDQADRDSFEAMAEHARVGGNVFFSLDVDHDPGRTLYGFFADPLSADYQNIGEDSYGLPVRFLEALG